MKKHRWLIPALLLLALILGGFWLFRRMHHMPEPIFRLQTPFFSGKHVLVLVPHQDDEINLAGGVMEQYLQSGSRVSLVYATNGDYNGLAEERSREVLAMAELLGIPKEDVYYLGYGNQWQPRGSATHIYFSDAPDVVWTSHIGATATYGTEAIDCYARSSYTRGNFCRDLKNLLLQLRPDVIYCNDYDAHHDHMALDLLFEEVLCEILTEEPGYRPAVYKGLCYGTAWYAEADFAGTLNPRSSRHPDWEHWDRLGIPYDWNSRLRLPMGAENRSPILSENTVYRALSLFESQNGGSFAQNVLNGDKVFFERRTDNLLLRATFTDGSEPVAVWNDFKLKDSEEFSSLINSGGHFAARITVRLPEPVEMNEIRLHTDPDSRSSFSGYLRFDSGAQADFRVSADAGEAVLSFPEQTAAGFEIHITDVQGEPPEFTEIEAFLTREAAPLLLMAVDENDDFAYDYRIPQGETAEFRLYAYPLGSTAAWGDLKISMDGSWGCRWKLDRESGLLRVTCPPGGRAVMRVTWSAEISTTFTVSNPLPEARQALLELQAADLERIESMYTTGE